MDPDGSSLVVLNAPSAALFHLLQADLLELFPFDASRPADARHLNQDYLGRLLAASSTTGLPHTKATQA
jgi:hypothetical protein